MIDKMWPDTLCPSASEFICEETNMHIFQFNNLSTTTNFSQWYTLLFSMHRKKTEHHE